jgi:hypothetical protein
VNGSIEATNGIFDFDGGVRTRSNPGTIDYLGELTIGQNDATLKLNNDVRTERSGANPIIAAQPMSPAPTMQWKTLKSHV